ncbi:MAG: sulfite exporter TauE/SafE family protein [Clostridia bacterium]|nr:sulfite exporter TauE/SafE family protein [Clostridia bacterium]
MNMKATTTWRVSGMHCPHCETAILRAVRDLRGLEDARADYRAGTLTARWDDAALPETALAERIAEAGYALQRREAVRPLWRRLLGRIALLIVLALVFLLMALSPLRGLLSRFPTARAGMGLGALFLVGLMTSLHCVAMCGGINLAQSAASAQSGRRVTGANLQYNLGRIISYTLVGGIVGAIGSVFGLSAAAQAGIQIAAAAFMVLMALNLMDIGVLKGLVPSLPAGLRTRLMGRGSRSSLYVGLLNGLMPCGPLQAMQLYALSTGSWWMGALSMLCFCLGTVPLMLGFGLVSGRLNKRFAAPMRIASGALVLLMGLSMLSNGLALAGVQLRLPARVASDTAAADEDIQLVSSELDWRGYPDITVKAGVPVRWTIHAAAEKITGCNNEMVIPALNLRVPLEPGDNVVEFTVDSPGVIPYTCWMGMLRGTITVE